MPTVAAIYARYSSNNQREASIEDQLRICREFCAANELTVTKEYTDHALTGRTDKRPGFLSMVADGEKHCFQTLVVYAMDRLSRDRYDLAIYKHRLKKAGVSIVYVTQPLGETPEAALMESLLEGMAAYYSENLARSVRRGLEGNALKGIMTSGRAPLGYKLTKERKYEPDPLTAPIVKEIFESYAAGVQKNQIIKSLNARGFKTSIGHAFQRTSLDTILHNELYTGVFRWSDIRIEDSVPPIISRELFERAQAMLAKNRVSRPSGKTEHEFALSGKLFCGLCSSPMIGDSGTSRTGTTYSYYICSKHKRGHTCALRAVRQDLIESAVLAACSEALTDENIIAISKAAEAYAKKEREQDDLLPALKTKQSETKTKISHLLSAIEQGIITSTTKQRLTELETELAALNEQISLASVPCPTLTAAHFAAFLSQFKSADLTDPARRRKFLDAILNHITVTETDSQIKAVLVFNLKTSTTLILPGSDETSQVGLPIHNPNFFVYSDCFVRTLYLRR